MYSMLRRFDRMYRLILSAASVASSWAMRWMLRSEGIQAPLREILRSVKNVSERLPRGGAQA